jgi:hypothetical protein
MNLDDNRWQSLAHWDWYNNRYNWQTLVKPYEFVGQLYKRLYV